MADSEINKEIIANRKSARGRVPKIHFDIEYPEHSSQDNIKNSANMDDTEENNKVNGKGGVTDLTVESIDDQIAKLWQERNKLCPGSQDDESLHKISTPIKAEKSAKVCSDALKTRRVSSLICIHLLREHSHIT